MIDVFEVAKLLMAHAVGKHGEDIDLICTYGSQARGDTHETSDLDIFYTPADGKSPPIGRTFLLDGILFDFWAIRWETLEGFASGDLRGWAFAPGLVQQATPLYVRSAEQAERLRRLQQRTLDLQGPECRAQMLGRAVDRLASVSAHLYTLQLAVAEGLAADVRHAGWRLIQAIWECLALANQVFFAKGFGKSLDDAERFVQRPANLNALISVIATSSDPAEILQAAEELMLETRQTLRTIRNTLPARTSPQEQFGQVYPEIKDMVGKLLRACDRADRAAAGFHAWELQTELTMMLSNTQDGVGYGHCVLYEEFSSLYRQLGFPDLLATSSASLNELADQARLLDEKLRTWLHSQSVDLCEYATMEEFEQSL